VSTDASLFPIYFFDCELFCEKCAQLKKFKIFSQKKYDKNYGKSEIPPNIPLFCKCVICGSTVMYATNEFAELQEEPTLGLCKIWGMSDLTAGDMVFHPTEKLCTVESINRIFGSLPQITLVNENKEKVEVQLDAQKPEEENTNVFYRLFPQNFEDVRVGDQIYNTETKLTGIVVGLKFNGGEIIIIKFENGAIEKAIYKKKFHYLTDNILELNAKWRCRDLSFSQNLQIRSIAKVLHVNCIVSNFNSVCELDKIISSIPQVRCSIMHVILDKADIDPNYIYKELLNKCVCICNCNIELKSQEAYITGFYHTKDTMKNIYRTLRKFPIKKINIGLSMRSDMKIIKTINANNYFIRISKMGKDVHIDGWVRSEKEKKRAKWLAFFYSLSFKIENHLWIING
jgi:hypothetical protein